MTVSLFLTGASGFLGARFLATLDPAAWRSITLLSRRKLALPERLQQAGNVTVIHASLHQVDRYADRLGADTLVLHLAAVTDKADRPQYFAVNTHATGLLIRAAETAQVRGMLYVSSSAVSFRNRRNYHYAESKEQAEQLLTASRLRYCILRPTIILGPGASIWNKLRGVVRFPVIPLPGSGRVRIQPVFVDDMVRLLQDFLAREDFANRMLEIGGPELLTLDDFMQRIHRRRCGGRAFILHLPLGLVLWPLRLLESFAGAWLPVSSGQFASFYNDGIVTANAIVQPPGRPMLGIDDMLAILLASDAARAQAAQLADECRVFARYLTGAAAADYVHEQYLHSFDVMPPSRLALRDRFDGVLLKLARVHPWLTQGVDIYSRLLRTDSVVRRRLVLLLALLESHGDTVDRLDRPDAGGLAGLVLGMGLRGLGSLLLLLPVLAVLLPLHLLLRGRGSAARVA